MIILQIRGVRKKVLHHAGWVTFSASSIRLPRSNSNCFQVGISQLELSSCDVFFQILFKINQPFHLGLAAEKMTDLDFGRSRNGDDIVSLCQNPSESDLACGSSML